MTQQVHVDYAPPHGPCRGLWCVTLDGYEPGDPVGSGFTEAEALEDLDFQLKEMREEGSAWALAQGWRHRPPGE